MFKEKDLYTLATRATNKKREKDFKRQLKGVAKIVKKAAKKGSNQTNFVLRFGSIETKESVLGLFESYKKQGFRIYVSKPRTNLAENASDFNIRFSWGEEE